MTLQSRAGPTRTSDRGIQSWQVHADSGGMDAPLPAKLIKMIRVGNHTNANPARTTPPPPALAGELPLVFAILLCRKTYSEPLQIDVGSPCVAVQRHVGCVDGQHNCGCRLQSTNELMRLTRRSAKASSLAHCALQAAFQGGKALFGVLLRDWGLWKGAHSDDKRACWFVSACVTALKATSASRHSLLCLHIAAFAEVYRPSVSGTWIRGDGDWRPVQQRAWQPLQLTATAQQTMQACVHCSLRRIKRMACKLQHYLSLMHDLVMFMLIQGGSMPTHPTADEAASACSLRRRQQRGACAAPRVPLVSTQRMRDAVLSAHGCHLTMASPRCNTKLYAHREAVATRLLTWAISWRT